MSTLSGTAEGERFPISPRSEFGEDEWFGLDANPEGTINVPFQDHYAPYPDWTGFEDENDTQNPTSGKAPTLMAGETTIIVIGNLTNDPELRFTTSGSAVANFTIASTPRTFDRASSEWKDGETLFLRAAVWREAAENVAESLTRGMRVIVSGRLKSRSYETKEGEKRTVIELEVDEIGPSLRYANATVNRAQRNTPAGGGNGYQGNGTPAEQSVPQEDPWATPQTASTGGGCGNGPDSEPPF
ncbi:single-stranded DNA-binding protein [[Micrococcus luteus] ATCC 49442]|uniref:single-stranded DNA-binding protein n=1 Tax=[Micrococcus luteus] ATCC 49442 TaxID=2698727 RepID=UPI001FCA65DC|nr:single-stranded DNA-binding protein [[Micrococcus luteus] ATCC 49442]